jgi:YnbE-like lipoprotein
MKTRNRILQFLNMSFSMLKAGEVHMHAGLTARRNGAIRRKMKKGTVLLLPLASLALPACVQVAAPDKPIVINLNIAIRQEVLLRLDEASKKVTEENPGIF